LAGLADAPRSSKPSTTRPRTSGGFSRFRHPVTFAQKAADIVALYLQPRENAVVLSVDEKPHIQALERAQGWLKLPNGKAFTGFNHEDKRDGTTTLFAALEVATGLVKKPAISGVVGASSSCTS
jgi:hypothetical protein